MKTISLSKIKELANCSDTTARHFLYGNIENGKLYINSRTNANATKNWLAKKFNLTFSYENDAPRGGKIGDYFTFNISEDLQRLIDEINKENELIELQKLDIKNKNQKIVDDIVITEEEKNKFLEKTKGLSKKVAKKIAYSFQVKKIGFYNNQAKDKFLELLK